MYQKAFIYENISKDLRTDWILWVYLYFFELFFPDYERIHAHLR